MKANYIGYMSDQDEGKGGNGRGKGGKKCRVAPMTTKKYDETRLDDRGPITMSTRANTGGKEVETAKTGPHSSSTASPMTIAQDKHAITPQHGSEMPFGSYRPPYKSPNSGASSFEGNGRRAFNDESSKFTPRHTPLDDDPDAILRASTHKTRIRVKFIGSASGSHIISGGDVGETQCSTFAQEVEVEDEDEDEDEEEEEMEEEEEEDEEDAQNRLPRVKRNHESDWLLSFPHLGGPEVPDLLHGFRGHVAHALWEGKDQGTIQCVGRSYNKFMVGRPRVLTALQMTGFSHLRESIYATYDVPLISAFL